MKNVCLLVFLLVFAYGSARAQNAIDGTGFNFNWSSDCSSINNFLYLSPSVNGTYITTLQPYWNFSGDRYFLLAVEWDGIVQRRSIAVNTDAQISIGQKYHLLSGCPAIGAMFVNSMTGHENFVFKTLNAGTNPTGDFVVFRVEGDVRDVTSVTQLPTIVPEAQIVTVTAGMSAALSPGQSAYLRYTLDNWSSSEVVEMTGSTTLPTAEIPASAEGETVKYYVFTSGSGLTISGDDADLFTINYNTNGGSNYSYEVQGASDFLLFDSFQRPVDDYGDIVGVPSSNPGSAWVEYETTSSGARTSGGGLHLGSTTAGRDMISFDMSNQYPVAFDASDEEMKWAFNLNINITDPSGFDGNNRGAAFILGCNKSNFTDADAFGYSVVLGDDAINDHIKLVRFQGGLKLNSNLTEIASVPNNTANSFFSIVVSYNSCSGTWSLKVREDSVFFQPNIGSFPLTASAVDNTYTSSDLPHLGALWNHSTGGSQEMRIDNIYIPNVTAASNIEYTWSGGASGSFMTFTNWTPDRECPRNRDRLIIDISADISDVSNQTIGQLIVENGAAVTLRNQTSQQTSTLTLTGGPGNDFVIESGSVLNLDSKNASYTTEGIIFELSNETTGEIFGTLQFDNSHNDDGRRHQLLVADADAVHVKNGGRIEAIDLLSSFHPFGNIGSQNVVIFESGSTYLQGSGSNPFGFDQPDSKVVFEPGSWYHYTSTGNDPSISGRTYANFKYEAGVKNISLGTTDYSIDTLFVDQGTLNLTLDANVAIAGDIKVETGASLSFDPTISKTVVINSSIPIIQNIYGTGTMTIGPNATLNLQNQNRINIQKNITVDGNANVLSNAVVDFEGENHFSGSGSTKIMDDSKVYLGSAGGIAASGNSGNIRTDDHTYSEEAAYVYDGTTSQVTGSGLPITLAENGSLEIDNSGDTSDNTVTLSHAGTTTTPKLRLTNGLLAVGTSNTVAISANGSINSTAGNFAAGNLAGIVEFFDTGTVDAAGDLDFWNVNLPTGTMGGVNFGLNGVPTIHNELVINGGRWVDNNGPFYDDGSTLVYNTGTNFIAGSEWYAGSDTNVRGIPYNVQIGRQDLDDTKLNFGSSDSSYYCRGSVNIGDSVGGTGYGFYLSNSYGGDLKLDGDFTVQFNGDFGANERAVFFVGPSHQTITSHLVNDTIRFDYLIIDKASGDVLLDDNPGTPVYVEGTSGGDVLVLSNGDIDLQGQTFNLGGSSSVMKVQNGNRTIKSETPADFNVLGPKEIQSNLSGALIFNDQVTVNISDGVDFGPDVTKINTTLQINAGGYANINAPKYGPNGVLKYNTGGEYLRRVEWSGTDGNAGYPNDVIVAGSTILKASGDGDGAVNTEFGARQDVTIESGSTLDMGNMAVSLVVGRDLTIEGELIASNVDNGDIHVAGDWLRTSGGTFTPNDRQVLFNGTSAQTITAAGGETFDYLGFENGGTKTLNNDITVKKNLDIMSGSGVLQPGPQTIAIAGNWNNEAGSSAFDEGTSTVIFNGTALQELSAPGGESFYALQMSNSGAGVKLMNDISILANLHFVDGLIDATTYRVDFENGATNSGSGDASYINGFARKIGFAANQEFMFPVGQFDSGLSINVYQPAALIAESASATATFTVDYQHHNFFPGTFDPTNLPPMVSPLVKVSTCNFWNINRDVAGTNAKVKLYWTTACLDINDISSLVVARINGSQWESQGLATAVSADPAIFGYVETNLSLLSFGTFAIGSVSALNVLPIELLSFTAFAENKEVVTHWVTSTEINNEYFTVERSVDALNFEEVGRVEGAGNSTSERSYSFTDDAPYLGISYYRLSQTDFDGKTTYSEIRSVQIDGDNGFELLQVYRSEDGLNLSFQSEVEILHVEIFDLLGKQLFVSKVVNNDGRTTIYPSLARGAYLLRLSNGVEAKTKKFFF